MTVSIRSENQNLPHPIAITSRCRIAAMTETMKRRVLLFRNARYHRDFVRMNMKRYNFIRAASTTKHNFIQICPTKWHKVICGICYNEILLRQIYFARNDNASSRYIHINCAVSKNMIDDETMDELFLKNAGCIGKDEEDGHLYLGLSLTIASSESVTVS